MIDDESSELLTSAQNVRKLLRSVSITCTTLTYLSDNQERICSTDPLALLDSRKVTESICTVCTRYVPRMLLGKSC